MCVIIAVANRQDIDVNGEAWGRECPKRRHPLVDALRWSRAGDSWQF